MRSCVWCLLFVFFFKQKTAYEMVGSDWSSDVCSSDLRGDGAQPLSGEVADRDRRVLAFDTRGLTGHEDRLKPEDVSLEGDLDARLIGCDADLAALVPNRPRTERQG